MTVTDADPTLGLRRHFTIPGSIRTTRSSGAARRSHHRPSRRSSRRSSSSTSSSRSWSQTHIIVAQKYFRGRLGTPERGVVAPPADRPGRPHHRRGGVSRDGYFADAAEVETFRDELTSLLVNQRVAFNSPVWFNIGVEGVPGSRAPASSSRSTTRWTRSSTGTGRRASSSRVAPAPGSTCRRSARRKEHLRGGGTPSGPVSFMRGADASAGTIKSGGKTRRAAKMVILDVDHPDVEEFVWCKAREERKARALRDAGFDMELDGADAYTVQYQNANNSVRVTDAFMEAVRRRRAVGAACGHHR